MKNTLSVAPEVTASMTSFALREIINASRVEHGESKVENSHLLKRIEDELEGELGESKVFRHPQSGVEVRYYDLTRDQCALVGMRESKGVRRSVLARLKEVEEQVQLHLNKPDPALYLEQAQHLLRREVQMFKQHALTELDSNLYTFRSVAKYVNEYGKCSRKLNDSSIRSMSVNAGWLTPCHTYVRNKGEYFIRLDMLPTTGRKSASRTLKLTWLGREVLTSEYAYAEPLDAEQQLRQYLLRIPSAVDGIPGVTRKEVLDHLILEWKQTERHSLPFEAEPLQRLAGHLSGAKLLLN